MKEKIAQGVAWLVGAKIVVNLIAFISTLIMARLLTPEDFGLVALATTMLLIISSFTEISIGAALIHHKEPTEAHFHTSWTLNLCRSLIVGCLFSLSAPFAAHAYNDDRLTPIMIALSISSIIVGLQNPKIALLTRSLVFKQDFFLSVLPKISGFVISITFAYLYKSYWALILGSLASQLASVVLSYVIIPYKPRFLAVHARELFQFSIWIMLSKIVTTLNWKFDHILVGSYLGSGALGQYTVGDNLAGMATREAVGPLETTLFPAFARMSNDPGRLKLAYRSVQSLLTAVALPVGVGTALVAHPLVLVGMGEKWVPVVSIIQVMSCVFALLTLASPADALAMGKGQTKMLFHRDLILLGIRVPIIVVGMILGGLPGVIYGRAITAPITIGINMHLVRRMIGTKILDQALTSWRSLSAAALMALGVTQFKNSFDSWGLALGYQANDTYFLVAKICAIALVGACIYILGHLVLWFLAKKPQGPETEILNALSKIAIKLKTRR